MKILLVEDDLRIAVPLKEELEHQTFSVDLAQDGPAGLALASGGQYDLILLDVMLPGLSGIDVCRRLREGGCDTAIVFTSALERSVTDELRDLKFGADDFLAKPFNLEEFESCLNAVLSRRKRLSGHS